MRFEENRELKLKTVSPANWIIKTAVETATPAAATSANRRLVSALRVAIQRIPTTQIVERQADSMALLGLAPHSAETAWRIGRAMRAAARGPVGSFTTWRCAATATATPTARLRVARMTASLGSRNGLAEPASTTTSVRNIPAAAIRTAHFGSWSFDGVIFATTAS